MPYSQFIFVALVCALETYFFNHAIMTVKDITDEGHLILEDSAGKRTTLTSGEVSLSSW